MRAIILNLIAHTVIPLNYAIAKYLSAEIPIFQIIWARHCFTVLLALPILFFFFKSNFVWTDYFWNLFTKIKKKCWSFYDFKRPLEHW